MVTLLSNNDFAKALLNEKMIFPDCVAFVKKTFLICFIPGICALASMTAR